MDSYLNSLEKVIDRHKFDSKLDIIASLTEAHERNAPDALSPVQIKCLSDKFDKEHTELEIHSETVYRKKKGKKLP